MRTKDDAIFAPLGGDTWMTESGSKRTLLTRYYPEPYDRMIIPYRSFGALKQCSYRTFKAWARKSKYLGVNA